MPKKRQQTRRLGDLVWTSHGPGHWLAADGRLTLIHMMRDTTLSEWHLFRTRPGLVPKKPFVDVAFWGWHNLTYALTMGEIDKQVRELRAHSQAMLPRLRVNETVVRCRRDWRLVVGVRPDGDGVGAILDVESAESVYGIIEEQWSTYGCRIEDKLPCPWPKAKG